jgi:hypothetical protein
MQIQVRLVKEQPVAFRHILHSHADAHLFLQGPKFRQRLVEALQCISPTEVPGVIAGMDYVKFGSRSRTGCNGTTVQFHRCIPKFRVDAGDIDVGYQPEHAVFQGKG